MLVKFHDHPSRNDAWIRNRSRRRRRFVEDDLRMQLTGDWGSDGLTLDMGDVDLDALYLFTAWDGRGTRRTGAGRCQSCRRRRFVEDDFPTLCWATSWSSWTTPFSGVVVLGLNCLLFKL